MTISYPSKVRPYKKIVPLNSSDNDFFNDQGVRLSSAVYCDLPLTLRKQLLNEVRQLCSTKVSATKSSTPSGLQVVEASSEEARVESFIGMTVDNLRNVLFQRGGLNVDLVLRLQAVTGLTFVTEKDFAESSKNKVSLIKKFVKDNSFE